MIISEDTSLQNVESEVGVNTGVGLLTSRLFTTKFASDSFKYDFERFRDYRVNRMNVMQCCERTLLYTCFQLYLPEVSFGLLLFCSPRNIQFSQNDLYILSRVGAFIIMLSDWSVHTFGCDERSMVVYCYVQWMIYIV